MRCTSCLKLVNDKAKFCERCGRLLRKSDEVSLLGKIKRSMGIEISSGIITLSLEQPEPFFSDEEIDSLLEPKNLKALDTRHVPNWEIMFFTSKRVNRPRG